MEHFISVIIPIYNDVEGARLVLDALLEQDYPYTRYEIIPVDNGSTDETKSVLKDYVKRYPDRIIYASEDEIQGSYAARNCGIILSKGEILAFTDADCVPDKKWLANGVNALYEKEAAFAAGHIHMTFQNQEPNIWEYVDAAGKLNQKKYVENSGFGATANLFVRREVFERHGMFDLTLQSGGDYEFGTRLSTLGEKLIYISDAVVNHPARATFKEKIKKAKRVAEGQRDLEKKGVLKHSTISIRSFIPTRRYEKIDGVNIGAIKMVGVLIAANILKYYNLFCRLRP